MAKILGRRAVVIGAGIGGLTAARVLADHFEQVLILERDALPVEPEDRPSIPQGRHVHGLLRGGQNALEESPPGFEHDLAAGGAVPVRSGLDVRVERPGFDPFPQRDLGITSYAMSRPCSTDGAAGRCRCAPATSYPPGCRRAGAGGEQRGRHRRPLRRRRRHLREPDRRPRRRRLGPGDAHARRLEVDGRDAGLSAGVSTTGTANGG